MGNITFSKTNSMIKNSIKRGKDYLQTSFTGQISVQDIKDYINSVLKIKKDKEDLKILINGLDSNLAIETKDLNDILNELTKLLTIYNSLKIAVIVDNPLNTAYSILFKRMIYQDHIRFELFSTELLAKKWMERKTIPCNYPAQ